VETILGIPAVLLIWWIFLAVRTALAFDDDESSYDDESTSNYASELNNSYTQASGLNVEDKLALLAQLARKGHASSLASYTWQCLNLGRHADAIGLYNETRMSLNSCANNNLGWELANCDSNHALHLLATGSPVEEARVLWDRNLNMNHNECTFYSKMMRVRDGTLWKNDLTTLPKALRNDIRATLVAELEKSAPGWYRDWLNSVLTEFGGVI